MLGVEVSEGCVEKYADVLWALAEYRVVTAERAQAGETEPSVPLTATPVGEPWPPEATVPSA